MKIDWSGARVLATLAIGILGLVIGVGAAPLIGIILGVLGAVGAWWIFPKIVKEV